MHFYSAYGLGIASDLELPELRTASDPHADLTIRRMPLTGPTEGEVYGSDAFHTHVPGVGLFYLREGRELLLDPADGAAVEEIRTAVLGPILSALLRQREVNVLHASSVVINGRAVVFIGPQCAGKSTMAQACYAAGHAVMADDVTGIVRREGVFCVLPGYAQIKLRNETAEALFENGKELPWLLPTGGKRITSADDRFPTRAYPLSRIYVLRIGERMDVSRVTAKEGLLHLLRNSRGIPPLEAPRFLQLQLKQCTELVDAVPVSVLRRMPDLERLREVVTLVERDLSGNVQHLESGTPTHSLMEADSQ